MRLCPLLAIVSLTLLTSNLARAEIKVDSARYKAGVLVVRGETSEPRTVVLDDHFRKKTFRNNRFLFRVRYLPNDCSIRLQAGSDEIRTNVENCKRIGPPRRPG
jgi:hypothetical protein